MSIDYFSDLEFVCHGELSRTHLMTYREHFDYWGVQFSRRGKFRLEIGDNPPEYAENSCVFISYPGPSFFYGAADPEDGFENKIYICFRGERVKRYLQHGLLIERSENALLIPGDPDKFMRNLRSIRTLLMLPDSQDNHARAVLALEHLLLDMHNIVHRGNTRTDQRYNAFAALTEKLASAPEKNWDFEKEARKLSVSYAHFRRLFEQFFQVPPGAFLLSARLEKAASLLDSTNLPIREIARECGFEDEFYFSRIFKKYHSVSPKHYRGNFR